MIFLVIVVLFSHIHGNIYRDNNHVESFIFSNYEASFQNVIESSRKVELESNSKKIQKNL